MVSGCGGDLILLATRSGLGYPITKLIQGGGGYGDDYQVQLFGPVKRRRNHRPAGAGV